MAIETKTIKKLLDYEFVIPNYQRGYRWDEEQVLALLNDLKEYSSTDNKDYYCLQPIVVVKDDQQSESGKERYIVVDGQQRLTTLFLILKALDKNVLKNFSLKFPLREKQQKFLDGKIKDEEYKDNIDNFYVRKAYDTIEAWGCKNINQGNINLFVGLIRSQRVRVIWYEIPQTDALAAFRRLNYGKIPLTPAELVKAVILQTDCYPKADQNNNKKVRTTRDIQTAIAQRRAIEWDEMEHRLADPRFAAMVCQPPKKDADTDTDMVRNGIEIVLDFVADSLNKELGEEKFTRKEGADHDNFVFNVIDTWIKQRLHTDDDVDDNYGSDIDDEDEDEDDSNEETNTNLQPQRQEVIDELWSKIQTTFNLLVDWYENRQWYHLIGLWRLMSNDSTRKFIAQVYKKSLDDDGCRLTKPKFTEALRTTIGKEIRVETATLTDEQTKHKIVLPPEQQHLNSPKLSYTESSMHSKMIRILEAFNVMTVQNEHSEATRFPFHLFQKYNVTSLEHLHPQNLTSEKLKKFSFAAAKAWYEDRKSDYRDADKDVWQRLAASLPSQPDEKSAKILVKESLDKLAGFLADEPTYEAAKADEESNKTLMGSIATLEKLFAAMADIDINTLHSIKNMALVSKELNSALSNHHLDKKRRIALEADESKENPTYVPPTTHMAYGKAFRPETPGNMKFWQEKDRKAYFDAIQKVYDYFTKD